MKKAIGFGIELPLEVYYSKNKKFILNLNNYRNAHYRILSSAKKNYTDELLPRLTNFPSFSEPVSLEYTYYARSNRRLDISNPCSIIDKFTCDALVKAEIIEDDSFKQVVEVVYRFGGVEKDNPRCELVIAALDRS
jgi:Holliday junction resolvase RusA-like endonuclease|tara:strand:- start:291 stop:698 length:408 start_codon:yes stop_codon:yes gene_type:complete